MASTRPASPRGIWIVLVAGVAAGVACTSPNPLYGTNTASDGGGDQMPAGTGGQGAVAGTGGQPGGQSGSDAFVGTGGIFGTGGFPGTGGVTNPGTGGIANPGTGGMMTNPGSGGVMGSGGVPDGGAGSGGTTPRPDASPPDSSPPDVVMGMPPAACGGTRPNLSSVTAARGIAIAVDGTFFFTRESGTQAWIGRVRPDGTTEPSWFTLPANSQPRVIRVDSERQLLFVADFNTNAVIVVRVNTAMYAQTVRSVTAPHGIALGEDGAAFVSTGDGHIVRLRPELTGVAMNIAATAVFPAGQRPLGLAIGPTGHLYVGGTNTGIKRYRINGDNLVEPTNHGTFVGTANDLAFDVTGRLYVADFIQTTTKPLWEISANAATATPITEITGRNSALAFGRGALHCDDLYIADAGAVVRRWMAKSPALRIP